MNSARMLAGYKFLTSEGSLRIMISHKLLGDSCFWIMLRKECKDYFLILSWCGNMCHLSLQIFFMIPGPRQWLLVLYVSAFSPCCQAQPWRFASKTYITLLLFPLTPICFNFFYSIHLMSITCILSSCSNGPPIMTVMWRTVGMGDLQRRQDGGSMMIKCNDRRSIN